MKKTILSLLLCFTAAQSAVAVQNPFGDVRMGMTVEEFYTKAVSKKKYKTLDVFKNRLYSGKCAQKASISRFTSKLKYSSASFYKGRLYELSSMDKKAHDSMKKTFDFKYGNGGTIVKCARDGEPVKEYLEQILRAQKETNGTTYRIAKYVKIEECRPVIKYFTFITDEATEKEAEACKG